MFTFLVLFFVISVTLAEEVFRNVSERHQVIFLPEEHTSREDHEFQLRFIRFLHSKGYRLFIAMEMFQQPFQPILEDYVACRIEEEEMLKRTEYARRWGFDPALYRDIWKFAKEKGIRIVAINLPSELVQKIGREGLENVRDESLPDPIIPQTERERRELKRVLASHPRVEEKRFFDVQNAWDNGMALAIARLSERYPEHRIVVLVGRGHARDYESGIPRKLKMLKPEINMKILKREDFQRDFLFSMDFSSESSSANSTKEPNCRP